MKSGIFLSLFIHSLFILLFLPKGKLKPEEEQKLQKASQPVNIEVIEAKTANKGHKRPIVRFYWGIGIETSLDNIQQVYGVPTVGYLVNKVFHGYSAEQAGIIPGDFIYMVDDTQISPSNDIKGDEYKKFKLTILRNGSIVYIHTERCRVEY